MPTDLAYVLTWVKDLFTSLWGNIVIFSIAIALVGLVLYRK